MIKTKLNHFSLELYKNHTERLKEKLQKETIKINAYTYKIKKLENNDSTCKYQLLPIALSSGYRNCFTPIIWIEILEKEDMSTVIVTLRTYTAVSIMLAVFCIGALLIETVMLIYLIYCMIVYRSTPTLEVLKLFVSFLIIPSAMIIACCFTLRSVKNALLDEIAAIR
ncbi:MAG: hypothetical protein IJ298_06010 [Ruminococcus sp.]|nr:hypothetical protein [Ruminococcus sp.]